MHPPSFTENMEYWDVGYINPLKEKTIIVNAMSSASLTRKTHSKYFMNLLKNLNSNGGTFNVKKEFSFNLVNAVFKFDDFHMNHSYFIDVFWDMDFRLISEKVTDEKELDKR